MLRLARGSRARQSALLGVLLLGLAETTGAQGRPELRASRVAASPRIDGALDDAAWQTEALTLGPWISYRPLRGDAAPDATDVRVVYDDRFVYVAFTCHAADPARIRTTVSRRDTVFSDDWVGLSLDSNATGQTAYHLMVNPSGIQMDAVNTPAAGERFESDFVWTSAAQRTSHGYTVEIAIPLPTIRFAERPDQVMGVLFWRQVSQSGIAYSWPEMLPGQWVFERHAHLMFPDLRPRRLRELLPSMTVPLSQARETPSRWSGITGAPDVGLSVKYGVTSQVTVDATVNPDFSQVESDAFQVQVNQRFPIFLSEKRPFFMEGLGLFALAGTDGDANMRRAVHTRRIVNPSWGAKVIGTAGRLSFGILESSDVSPGATASGGAVTGRAEDGAAGKLFTIGRATYALGQSNYVGAILLDTRYGGRRNQVVGTDLSWKPSPSHGITATYLASRTEADSATSRGAAAQLTYRYDTRRAGVTARAEHYDQGFEMDSAFYNRTGFTSFFTNIGVNFYPEAAKRLGLVRLQPFVLGRTGEDRVQGGDDRFVFTGMAFDFQRQGFFRVQTGRGHERWRGQRFDTSEPFGAFGGVQILRWLSVGGYLFPRTQSTFYDPATPFQGRANRGGVNVEWQPNQHFNQSVGFDAVRFNRADTGAWVYSVNILNLKTVYQFDRRLFGRLLTQFDGAREQWLFDLLASYEFVPGTALYAGYGVLHERRGFEQGQFVPNAGAYITTQRGLFLKASYLYRF